eukprot:4098930-Pyramimonas_sp.AAC.1
MAPKKRERCLQEVQLLQTLHHPNIISMLDSFIEDNMLIIVFEWALGGDLKRLVRRQMEQRTLLDESVIWGHFIQSSRVHYLLATTEVTLGTATQSIKFEWKGVPCIRTLNLGGGRLQITGALRFMHSKRIMHRDIKPANVLVTASGLKLGDLGLGRHFSTHTQEAFSKVRDTGHLDAQSVSHAGLATHSYGSYPRIAFSLTCCHFY